MAEEDSQLCLQSVQFMTHNMLATSFPRSKIFSWTSKTSRRQSLKSFWTIHGLVVKLPMKQLAGFEGQGNVRIGQLSFSFRFSCHPIHQPLVAWLTMSFLFRLLTTMKSWKWNWFTGFQAVLALPVSHKDLLLPCKEWKKEKASENNIYIFMWNGMFQNWLPVSRSC